MHFTHCTHLTTLGERGIMLKFGFQIHEIISPTVNSIRWCMQVYVGVGVAIGPVWLGPNDLHPRDVLGVPSHWLNSTKAQLKGITQTITLTLSRPVGFLTHLYQAPSWEAQTPPFLRLWCDGVGNRHPPAPLADSIFEYMEFRKVYSSFVLHRIC